MLKAGTIDIFILIDSTKKNSGKKPCYKKHMGKKTPHDIALLSEGEIEIMVYIYWQLVTPVSYTHLPLST